MHTLFAIINILILPVHCLAAVTAAAAEARVLQRLVNINMQNFHSWRQQLQRDHWVHREQKGMIHIHSAYRFTSILKRGHLGINVVIFKWINPVPIFQNQRYIVPMKSCICIKILLITTPAKTSHKSMSRLPFTTQCSAALHFHRSRYIRNTTNIRHDVHACSRMVYVREPRMCTQHEKEEEEDKEKKKKNARCALRLHRKRRDSLNKQTSHGAWRRHGVKATK